MTMSVCQLDEIPYNLAQLARVCNQQASREFAHKLDSISRCDVYLVLISWILGLDALALRVTTKRRGLGAFR